MASISAGSRLKHSRLTRRFDIREELPAAFKRDYCTDAQEAVARRLLSIGTPQAMEQIVTMYLPTVTGQAFAFARRWRGRIEEEVDELIGDGCVALLSAARTASREEQIVPLRYYFSRAIQRSFYKQHRARTWGGYAGDSRHIEYMRFRRNFARHQGRSPTRREMEAHLAQFIKNPLIQVGERPSMGTLSDVGETAEQTLDNIKSADDVEQTVIDREVIRLAMKGLKGLDRKIFKMAIDGHSLSKIAGELQVGKAAARYRVNGILWEARRRADLAAYLGVEPAKSMQRDPSGRPASIHIAAPAPLAASA